VGFTVELYNPITLTTTDISAKVSKVDYAHKLDAENDEFKIACFDLGGVKKFQQVKVKKDGVIILSGIVLNQKDSAHELHIVSELGCMDWSYLFNRRAVAKSYTDKTLDYILNDLVASFIPELTTTNVRSSLVTFAGDLLFQYTYAFESIKKIIESAYGWHWYVDALKDVHLFETYETDGVDFTTSNIKMDSFSVDYLGDVAANKLWIVGAKQAGTSYIDQYFTGDGQQRYFNLAYEPNYSSIYVGATLKNSKLEQNDDGAQDFLINKKGKVFYIPTNIVTPFTGVIKFRYRPTLQIIDYYENQQAQNEAGILLERIVKNKDITDRLSARQYGKAEIKRKAVQKRIINFITSAEVKVGERCQIDVIQNGWDVSGKFLVTAVSGSITADLIQSNFKSVDMEEIV
jgi:hypothetical protein